MPISVIREGRSPSKPWLPSDRLLSIALTLHERSIMGCGHYIDEPGDWKAEEFVCKACAAVEKHQADHEKPTPGAKVVAINVLDKDFGEDELKPEFG